MASCLCPLLLPSEFSRLLQALQIDVRDAKALRFFRICDNDGSGEIDFEEFLTVLYAFDPGMWKGSIFTAIDTADNVCMSNHPLWFYAFKSFLSSSLLLLQNRAIQ